MKECREIRELLSAMLDDAVTIEEQQRIAIHLTTCPRCQEALTELRRTTALLRDQGEVEAPPWLTTRIMARIAEESAPEPRTFWQRLFQPWPIKIPLQALALVALCVTGYYLTRENIKQVDFSPPARDEAAPASAPVSPAPAPVSEPTREAKPAPAHPMPPEPKVEAPTKPAAPAPASQAPPAAAPRAKDSQPATTFAPPPPAPLMLKESSRGAAPAKSMAAPAAERANEAVPQMKDAAGAKRKGAKEESVDDNWDSPPLILRLIPNDSTTISGEISRLAQRLGGSGSAISPRAISVQLPAQRYQDFQAGLGRLGILQVAQRAQTVTGQLHLHISWD